MVNLQIYNHVVVRSHFIAAQSSAQPIQLHKHSLSLKINTKSKIYISRPFHYRQTYPILSLKQTNYIKHKMVDYYKTLDVNKSATEVEIKKA